MSYSARHRPGMCLMAPSRSPNFTVEPHFVAQRFQRLDRRLTIFDSQSAFARHAIDAAEGFKAVSLPDYPRVVDTGGSPCGQTWTSGRTIGPNSRAVSTQGNLYW
jgi:hypothetical protein